MKNQKDPRVRTRSCSPAVVDQSFVHPTTTYAVTIESDRPDRHVFPDPAVVSGRKFLGYDVGVKYLLQTCLVFVCFCRCTCDADADADADADDDDDDAGGGGGGDGCGGGDGDGDGYLVTFNAQVAKLCVAR